MTRAVVGGMLLLMLTCTACGRTSSGSSPTSAESGAQAQISACANDPTCGIPASGVYVLGSSFSWDALPMSLDSDPVWHIFCGKSLEFIFQNPYQHCVASSTPWPDVLQPPASIYGYLSFQPVPGPDSTLALDVERINSWLAEQPPSTVGVIHATWPPSAAWEARLHDSAPDDSLTNDSLSYGITLQATLERANPGRRFVRTRSNEMIDFVFHDPDSPLGFDELFRDGLHMSRGPGRYLQHNALRQALGQQTGVDSTANGVAPEVRGYLDGVVELFPPTS